MAWWKGFVVVIGLLSGPSLSADPARDLEIRTDDVERFFQVYDVAGGHPTAEQLQHDYLERGSEGLYQLARIRNVTGARIAESLERQPEVYAGARRCMAVLPRVRERVVAAVRELGRRYPEARLPPVTIVVGRGRPVAVGSPVTGIQVGLEALCATDWLNPHLEDRFVYVIAHEYAHVQQAPALVDDEHPTVLEGSLVEGIAELTAELTAGEIAYSHLRSLTSGRTREIETAFVADKDKADISGWLYNTAPGKPGDLGYWVGYRIARSYYLRAADKDQALRELLQATDAAEILERSGWYPGIELAK
jgi:hypothetical protein